MIANSNLHRIRTGEATPAEARETIRALIAKDGPKAAPAIYGALRGWTWKALQMRRFDDDLAEWFKVIKATASVLGRQDGATSKFVEGLAHLVDDSLRFAVTHAQQQLAQRSHLGEILEIVRRNNGRIGRDQLEREAALGSSHLSQLLGELQISGALERRPDGKKAVFILTETGRDLLEHWHDERRARATPQVEEDPTLHLPQVEWLDTQELRVEDASEAADEPPTVKNLRFLVSSIVEDEILAAGEGKRLGSIASPVSADEQDAEQSDRYRFGRVENIKVDEHA